MTNFSFDLTNETRQPARDPIELPETGLAGKDAPANYLPDQGLVDALRATLLLRRPLLITGEPGTGKTQAAHYLNWKLGYGERALRFDAKSTSTARDLFYGYNTIARFHAAQTRGGSQNDVDYIQFNALGTAILRAIPKALLDGYLPSDFRHSGLPTQSIVLIDEIDKAPRDFPNDLLNELENMMFKVPELGNREFRADTKYLPVVVITSNSEKNLPPAFLRRCIYYHIQKPTRDQFALILRARLGVDVGAPLMGDALNFLMYSRSGEAELTKKPATAELLDFVLVLQANGAAPNQRFSDIQPLVVSALGTLIKGETEDKQGILKEWLSL
jgi:MoxR-like ATPase